MSACDDTCVAVFETQEVTYPACLPFNPAEAYPEYMFESVGHEPNFAYAAVRGVFNRSKLDPEHFGTGLWNPLRNLLQPGWTVLLKPNLVHHQHPHDPDGWLYVMTHGSIIRAVADYVWKAIGPTGKIILADAPQADASFESICSLLGLNTIRDFYRSKGLSFEVLDLRRQACRVRNEVIVERRKLAGDPMGAIVFDLGADSEFADHQGAGHYYGADYDTGAVNRHHSQGHHQYSIAASAIQCDAIFNLPKMKTHKKAGVTLSLKNLLGVVVEKNWLPHHTERTSNCSGDESPDTSAAHTISRRIINRFRQWCDGIPAIGPALHQLTRTVAKLGFDRHPESIRSGNWWKNDTIWRTSLDVNKAVLYGESNGQLLVASPENRHPQLVLVDGILAGQGYGPLAPNPFPAGIVAFGTNAPSVDAACTYLMGFDPDKVPVVRQAFCCHSFPLVDHKWRAIRVLSNRSEWNRALVEIESTFHFEPSQGWRGRIEREALIEHVGRPNSDSHDLAGRPRAVVPQSIKDPAA